MPAPTEFFRKCSSCGKPIQFGGEYFRCSVSTCNRPRLAVYFCTVACWEAHAPEARHRDAWAEPAVAPTRAEWEAREAGEARSPGDTRGAGDVRGERRRIVPSAAAEAPAPEGAALPHDVLVVVSKLKAYVKARSGMNTSDGVVEPLSDLLRQVATEAIREAARNDRRTVLDRDVARAVAILQGKAGPSGG